MSWQIYRCYDADGKCLYIGMSRQVSVRLEQHANEKPWWGDVVTITVRDTHGSRIEAHAMERAAILREQPLHNRRHLAPAGNSREGRRQLSLWIDADLRKQIRIEALKAGITIQSFMEQALRRKLDARQELKARRA